MSSLADRLAAARRASEEARAAAQSADGAEPATTGDVPAASPLPPAEDPGRHASQRAPQPASSPAVADVPASSRPRAAASGPTGPSTSQPVAG
ncbi:MAG: hypothetical protein ACXVWZ_05410, partial [Nocardioides sp.]